MRCRHHPIAILTLLLAVSFAPTSYADEWSYTLRPGDDLWNLAAKFCGSATMAERIAQHNQLANPAALRAGNRIRIPTQWLVFAPAAATVVEVQGEAYVFKTPGAESARSALNTGSSINMGERVVTGDGSVLVQFADQSTLSIEPDSRVLFNKLTAFGPAGMVDTHLRFAYGRGTSRVQPQNRGDRFRIETPEGVAAVRGTEFRIAYQPDVKTANSETLEGRVAFFHLNQNTDLPAGYGVAANPSGITREALLPAPQFISRPETLNSGEVLSWQPIPQADHYIVTWSEQSRPQIILRREKLTETQVAMNITPAHYEIAVRGVSQAGIEGTDARQSLVVRAAAPTPSPRGTFDNDNVALTWTDEQNVSGYQGTITAVSTQRTEAFNTSEREHTTTLAPGQYEWRVQSDTSAWSTPRLITVRPHAVRDIAVKRKGKDLAITWAAVKDAESYQLTLTPRQTNAAPLVIETSTQQAELTVAEFDRYDLSVVAKTGGIVSEASEQAVNVRRQPWWLLGLVALILLA